jgi:hypothetical protein
MSLTSVAQLSRRGPVCYELDPLLFILRSDIVNLKTFSTAWLCLGVASLGVLAACAEGEPIASDFKAVGGKGGHAGHGGSLAAGGSSVESGGSDQSSSAGSGGAGGSESTSMSDAGSAGSVSGDSGMAGGGAAYDGPLSNGLKVETQSQETKTVSYQVRITNTGTDSPPVSSLKARYYLVADSISDASSVVFDYASWNSGSNVAPYNLNITALSKATYAKLTPAKPMADSYLEVGSDSGDTLLSPKDWIEFHVRLNVQGEDPTNDYSYKAASAFTVNDHMVVTQGGNVVAGMAP